MGKGTFSWNGNQYSAVNGIQESVGEQLLDSITFRKDMKVLDAGCGSGNLTFKIGERVPSGHVTAIDLSESMIKKCNEEVKLHPKNNIEFKVDGINDITFENEFDILFSNSVLHWISDINDAAERFYKALKYRGCIGLQFPLLNERHPLVSYANRAIQELKVQGNYDNWKFPWYVPKSPQSFAKVLRKAGFSNVDVSLKSNQFQFSSGEEAFLHFQSVGLNLYTAPLADHMKNVFTEQVKSDLERDFPGTVTLEYERLFAFGEKS